MTAFLITKDKNINSVRLNSHSNCVFLINVTWQLFSVCTISEDFPVEYFVQHINNLGTHSRVLQREVCRHLSRVLRSELLCDVSRSCHKYNIYAG